jgi:UDP-N-acetylglucosamine 2-epimerase (non-hydrolysing)
MPEEINRIVTDALADLLWTPSPDADQNLRREGVPAAKIERVGNIMIDSFELLRGRIEADGTHTRLGLAGRRYAVVTLHRPSNVDDPATLSAIVAQLRAAAASLTLLFPVHPRTRKQLDSLGLYEELRRTPGIMVIDPLGYVPFMNLVTHATLAITDSGGLQEETTYLDIPCLTLRPNTERPITVAKGTNRLVTPDALLENIERALAGEWARGRKPSLWDGRTAGRCLQSLRRRLGLAEEGPQRGEQEHERAIGTRH